MKSLKKFLALALALALCFVMALPAMAADTNAQKTETLHINATPGHAYSVYQIFKGDLDPQNKDRLSNVKYGQNYLPNGVKEGDPVPETVVNQIANDPTFAATLLNDKTGDPYGTLNSTAMVDDINYSIKVAPGYYLVVDKGYQGDEKPETDADSALMVQVIGETTINPKTHTPELEKKVQQGMTDDNKINWQDEAGHEIGESFKFELVAEIPVEQLRSYAKYEIAFKDIMSEGLTFEGKDTVSIVIDAAEEADKKTIDNYTFEYLKDGVYSTDAPESMDGITFRAKVGDLLAIIGKADPKAETMPNWPIVKNEDGVDVVRVILTYNAHLNEKAKDINNGGNVNTDNSNPNTGILEYTKYPSSTGDGETDETPPDIVYVFTFDIPGTKTDGKDNAVPGAEFELYKADANDKKVTPAISFVMKDGKYVLYDKDVFGPAKSDENPDGVETTTTVTTTEKDGKQVFDISGLGVGKYILTESKTPDGYNTAADILLTIEKPNVTVNKDDGSNVVKLNVTKTYLTNENVGTENLPKGEDGKTLVEHPGSLDTEIVNKKGTLLPSTGGIGTTIFYAAGGALVVGAGVLLFIKKRMGSKG